jgi:hypothetical protein
MAGTLTISTLSDGTNSTSATNCILGSAKAWVNFNGTVATPSTIRSSYNVSSITKNTTGDYTINFTNAMPNVNYALLGTSGFTQGGSTTSMGVVSIRGGSYGLTTTTASIATMFQNGSAQDNGTVCVSIFSS